MKTDLNEKNVTAPGFKTFCCNCHKEIDMGKKECTCGSQVFFQNRENAPIDSSNCLKCGEEIGLREIGGGFGYGFRKYCCKNKECDFFLNIDMYLD